MSHESLIRLRRDNDQMKAVVGSDSRNDSPEVIEAKHHNFSQRVGAFSIRTLQEVENHVEHDRQSRKIRAKEEKQNSAEVLETEALEAASHSAVEDVDETCTRYDIQKATASLMKHTEDNRQELGSRERYPKLDPESKIQNDMDTRNPVLHICVKSLPGGIAAVRDEPQGTNSLRIFLLQAKVQFPICGSRNKHVERRGIYGSLAVLRDCSTFAPYPGRFSGSPGLDKQIQLLDGSIASAATALQVIRNLLEHAPPSTIWVIDGLNLAESHSTNHILNEFVAILRKQEQLQVSSKACFTTDGNSRVLMSAIMVHERVDASRMALAGPGWRLRGSADVTTGLNSW